MRVNGPRERTRKQKIRMVRRRSFTGLSPGVREVRAGCRDGPAGFPGGRQIGYGGMDRSQSAGIAQVLTAKRFMVSSTGIRQDDY